VLIVLNKKDSSEELINLLLIIKGKMDETTDINWTSYESVEEIIKDIDDYITSLIVLDYTVLEEIKNQFLPTCTFQELSVSNGWGSEFLELANRFDILYEKLSVE
jgi:hypothetical protein